MDRIILHADLNNFYASVEALDKPHLADVPMAVCGNPDNRHGIILAKNMPAKALGIKTAETVWQAKQKCPTLVLIPPHFEKYTYFSKAVRSIYFDFTDRIETFGLDECWLDVTGSEKLFGDGKAIADLIREKVKAETKLTVSVGVSFTKPFAKLGSDLKKPDATTVISRDNYKKVVWTLPVSELLFIGRQTTKKLRLLNINTIGELANADEKLLTSHFGINGAKMKLDASGTSRESVLRFDMQTPIKSVGNGITTRRDMDKNEDVRTVIFYLAETIASRLRAYGFMAMGISVHLRDNTLSTMSKQKQLFLPTEDSKKIADEAYNCFLESYNFKKMPPLRTLTVTTFNLISNKDSFQASLFDLENESSKKLGRSLDKIRDKYGFDSITKAAFIDSSLVASSHTQDDDTLPFQKGNR